MPGHLVDRYQATCHQVNLPFFKVPACPRYCHGVAMCIAEVHVPCLVLFVALCLSLLSLFCATRTSRNLLPFFQITNFSSSFSSLSLSPSILTCHPCCGCLGGSVVGGFPAPRNVGRLLRALSLKGWRDVINVSFDQIGLLEPVGLFCSEIFWTDPLARKTNENDFSFKISDWRSYLVTSSGHQAVHYIKWVVAGALQHKPGWQKNPRKSRNV